MTQISIIVPVYNAAKTLRPCLDSILNLDFQDFELLLIDDGSIDNSLTICEEYANRDKRIHVFHQENRGVSSARNKGLQICSGNWITFVDSDDMVSKDYLNGVENSQEDMIMVGYWNLSPDGKEFWSKHVYLRDEIIDVPSFLNSKINSFELRGPYCKFYRHSLLNNISFHEDMKVAEDSCFVMDYLKNVHFIKLLSESYYVFRCHHYVAAKRYETSVAYAIMSLCHLKQSYDQLVKVHLLKKNHFLGYLFFFKSSSMKDWRDNPSKWYDNKDIRGMYKYVWSDLSLKQKIKILGAFILKK